MKAKTTWDRFSRWADKRGLEHETDATKKDTCKKCIAWAAWQAARRSTLLAQSDRASKP